jgi:hypothetical protein
MKHSWKKCFWQFDEGKSYMLKAMKSEMFDESRTKNNFCDFIFLIKLSNWLLQHHNHFIYRSKSSKLKYVNPISSNLP